MSRRLRIGLLAGALAVLACAAVAPAAAPDRARTSAATPGVAYGGGALPESFQTFNRRRGVLLTLGVNGNGTAAVALVFVQTQCGIARFVAQPRIDANGEFRVTGLSRVRERGRRVGIIRYVVFGRFEPQSAAGGLETRLSFRRRGRRTSTCRLDADWQARTVQVPPGSGPPAAAGRYYGLTSQRLFGLPMPFAMRVSNDARRTVLAAAFVRRRCTVTRPELILPYSFPGAPIQGDGTFHSRERIAFRVRDARGRVVGTERFVARADGDIAGARADGTLSVRSHTNFRRGRDDRCRTGTVSWSATT